MESLKCLWCNSEGQQCSGSLKLQGAYSTDGVYYDGPNKNDITEYYICDTCDRGFNRCFSWSQWVKSNNSKKESVDFISNKLVDHLVQDINRIYDTKLIVKNEQIFCNIIDWVKIIHLILPDLILTDYSSSLKQGFLGHIGTYSVYMDNTWNFSK